MVFDPKRAARVGAKKLRQREDLRIAKRQIDEELEDDNDFISEKTEDYDSEYRDADVSFKLFKNKNYRGR